MKYNTVERLLTGITLQNGKSDVAGHARPYRHYIGPYSATFNKYYQKACTFFIVRLKHILSHEIAFSFTRKSGN